jgi:transposase
VDHQLQWRRFQRPSLAQLTAVAGDQSDRNLDSVRPEVAIGPGGGVASKSNRLCEKSHGQWFKHRRHASHPLSDRHRRRSVGDSGATVAGRQTAWTPTSDLRQVFNAIRNVTRSGALWWMVPRDLVPWGTAWSYVRRWSDDGTWRRLHDALRADVRRADGRDHAAILDSQSVKTVNVADANAASTEPS